jgi:putative Mg2+ transporter-C (MgtC) family protein
VTALTDVIRPFAEPLARLGLAALLGALLGLEREWHNRSAGLRTNTLIALGSAVFTLMSIMMVARDGQGDATRIPAQIVTGIGFLGGGAILRTRGGIQGLTTAATIWVNAAVGVAAGAGLYALAISATLTALVVLVVLKRVEHKIDLYRPPEPLAVIEPRAAHKPAPPPD